MKRERETMPAFSANTTKHIFYFVCVPTRLTLAFVAAYTESECTYTCKVVVSILCFFVFFSFLKNFFVSKHGFFNNAENAWWNPVRPFHSAAYLTAGILLWSGIKRWWLVLFADVFVGVIVYAGNSYIVTKQPTYINLSLIHI